MPASLRTLLEHPALWRGEECARNAAAVPSGFGALDACLPGGGWPQGALTELVVCNAGGGTAPAGAGSIAGSGELSLLMPACARLTQAGRWVIFIAPPHIPYAPALADAGLDLARLLLVRTGSSQERLWALEQALKSRHCGAALAWLERIDDRSRRRLQLACEQGGTSGFLYLPERAAHEASTAALKLALSAAPDGSLDIRILKRRGGMLARTLRIATRFEPGRESPRHAASHCG